MSETCAVLGELRNIVAQGDFYPPEGISDRHERGDAAIYRELIWQLARGYGRESSFVPEMTHSEYGTNPVDATRFLDFCTVFESENEEVAASGQGLEEFEAYLRENQAIIPDEIRRRFKAYIGYNYGTHGAIVIDGETITRISQEAYDALSSEGSIGYNDSSTHLALMNAVSGFLGRAATQ